MIRKAVWRIESTAFLACVGMGIAAAVLGLLGLRFSSPWLDAGAGLFLAVLIYRLRYGRV